MIDLSIGGLRRCVKQGRQKLEEESVGEKKYRIVTRTESGRKENHVRIL